MKKIAAVKSRLLYAVCILLVALFAFLLVGCGGHIVGGDNGDNSNGGSDNVTNDEGDDNSNNGGGSNNNGNNNNENIHVHKYVDYFCESCGVMQPNAPATTGLEYIHVDNSNYQGYFVSAPGTAANQRTVIIPSTYNNEPVVGISYMAFDSCEKLVNLYIPDTVESIERAAFAKCINLTSVNIPDIVSYIGVNPFVYCDSLSSITVDSKNSVFYSKNNCLINKSTKTMIAGCGNSVIPNDGSVNTIAEFSLFGLDSLTELVIPSSIAHIDENAIGGCDNLTSLTVNSGNSIYYSKNNCVINRDAQMLVVGCKNSVIPSDGSVKSIGDCAFREINSITKIEIPSGITKINSNAFAYCEKLKTVVIPSSVTYIDSFAFLRNTSLTLIDFRGTTFQWEVMDRSSAWDFMTAMYTIKCTDGTLYKSSN